MSTFGVDNDWIIKFPRTPLEFDLMRAECRVSELLAGADLPAQVSKPVLESLSLVSPNRISKEIYYEIMPKIRGCRPKECTPKLAGEIGEFLGALHNVKVCANDKIVQSDWNMCVSAVLNKNAQDVSLKKRLYHSVILPFYTEYIDAAQPVLCHLDIHLGNLLVDKKGHLSAVIDFGGARITAHSLDKPSSSSITDQKVLNEAYQAVRGVSLEDDSRMYAGRKVLKRMETVYARAIDSAHTRV